MMNKFALPKSYWPLNDFYAEDLHTILHDIRQNAMTYFLNSEIHEVQEYVRDLKTTIYDYYNLDQRSNINAYIKCRNFMIDQMDIDEYIMQFMNGRKTRFFVAKLSGVRPVKAVIGIHGTNEDAGYFLNILDRHVRKGHEEAVGFLKPLVKAGYLVICPDLPFHGEDYPDKSFHEERFGANICEVDILSRLCGHSFMHETIHRTMGLIDLILSGEVGEIQHLGITGYSLGGSCAVAIAACDERIASVANFMGISTYEKFLKNKRKRIVTSTYTLGAGFLGCIGDIWNLAAAICSRPFFITACTKDIYTDYEGVSNIREIIEALYSRYGGKYQWSDFDREHKLNGIMENELVSWFEETL